MCLYECRHVCDNVVCYERCIFDTSLLTKTFIETGYGDEFYLGEFFFFLFDYCYIYIRKVPIIPDRFKSTTIHYFNQNNCLNSD